MADTELAGSLVEVLDRLGEDEGWEGPGFFLRADADNVDVLPLGGRHPEDVLLGHRVAPEWRAVGLLTWGWGAPVDGPMRSKRPSEHPERVRSRTAIAVGRYGDIRARSRLADGRVLEEAPEGWLVDCLLRAVDRPTPPPAEGTETLFAAHWLARILPEVRRSGGLTWRQAAALHPALQMLAMAEEAVPDPESIVLAAAALSRVCGWTEVRWQCIERSWLADQVSPSLATWMDEGMLSRHLLSQTTPLPELLRRLNGRLTPAVARRVRRTLRELGVLSGSAGGDGVAGGEDAPLPVDGDDAIGGGADASLN